MKVLALGASSSTASINKKLATYTANLMEDADIEILDLNDFEMPLFSEDTEKKIGQPEAAVNFLAEIADADRLIISFAEHNGFYTAAYKNLFDWCSRINPKVFQDKPMILLATSPGGRGAKSVLELATNSIPRFGGDIRASISVPSFYENFDIKKGAISSTEINDQLISATNALANVD